MKTIIKSTRLLLSILIAFTLTVALGANGANAQEAVYLVQYAERSSSDDALTEVGQRRAKALARMLMDAGIDVIYSSEGPPAVQTAEPTAKALNIKVNILPHFQIEAMDDLVRRLRTQHAKHRVFIATARRPRDQILKAYGVTKEVWKARTDNLIVIVPRSGSEPLVIKMRW